MRCRKSDAAEFSPRSAMLTATAATREPRSAHGAQTTLTKWQGSRPLHPGGWIEILPESRHAMHGAT